MDAIRITSGKLKGLTIATPGGKTHPMGARERLALFNMIGEYLPGASVLDAFSGSGALGIEALSRGASHATLVENNTKAIQVIKANLKKAGVNEDATVIKGDVYEAEGQFDLVMADPPYDEYDDTKILVLEKLVQPAGILVLSHPDTAPQMPGMELLKTHQYAAAHISLYTKG